MKFPYGICDFRKIVGEQYFYVDRTDRIPLIEEAGSQLLFLRPRRFGKTLLLSTLENYYDIARTDEFESLFAHLAIGQNPTAKHNQYLVLKWDFSLVDTQGDAKALRRALHNHLNNGIKAFAKRYQALLPYPVEIDPNDAISSFESALTAVQASPHPLYLLIDEYDNFANEIMMGGGPVNQQRYEALLYGEGSVKTLFKAIKSASAGRGLDRVFITGVSPVVMSDITSGYNVAESVYLKPQFNDLCGFGESEIETALQQITADRDLPSAQADEALTMMRTFYDGYCFSYGQEPLVYNPTLALYFMKNFQESGQYPRQLLDSNLAMDRGKISYISQLPNGEALLLNALNREQALSVAQLAHRFGVEDMLHAVKDTTFMASLLYYFGVLTLGGETPFGETVLKIPNLVVRKLYIERLRDMLLPDVTDQEESERAARALYQTGDMQALCDFVETRYFKVFDNRDYRWANELTVKVAFLTLLFNDTFYIMDSETELERDYADLTMILRPDMRRYRLLDILIEFKYVGLPDAGLTGAQVKKLDVAQLKALPAVRKKLAESRTQLQRYREVLEAKYGDELRLHCYSVIALGFERLVWERA